MKVSLKFSIYYYTWLKAQSLPPDYIVVETGETLTPQQSRTLCEWSQRPLFHAAAPATPHPEIEIVHDDDQDDDDDDADDDDADKNDAKHMRPSPEP